MVILMQVKTGSPLKQQKGCLFLPINDGDRR